MKHTTSIPLLKPMLAVSSQPFDSREYIFEVKWDGYRAMAYLDKGVTELRSRNLLDISGMFPDLVGIHRHVKSLPALLDGEVVVFSGGRPSFGAIQSRGRLTNAVKIKRYSEMMPATYVAFDILYVSGRAVMDEPLLRRKEMLAAEVKGGGSLAVSEYVAENGVLLAEAARDQGLEGIMAKSLNSPYLPGRRSPYWKKVRHTREADLGICGYRVGKGGRRLGALLLCGSIKGKTVYVGKVGTGFSREIEEDLISRLQKIKTAEPQVAVPRKDAAGVTWVRPHLVCTVEYLETTGGGYLRHPSFKGLRFDKEFMECGFPEDSSQMFL
ncbi:MAG: non-homologous end-joining DNA ligase [Bacillota bacterium]